VSRSGALERAKHAPDVAHSGGKCRNAHP
jgi:hypothetical protein